MSPAAADSGWRRAATVFQERAGEYDSWYDNSPLFAAELAALHRIEQPLPEPRVEIGVGPGRFAEQLGVTTGIDPAPAALQLAQKRGIIPVAGIGEQLPLRTGSAGTVFILFTLCFLEDPAKALRECHRVLADNGRLVIGQVPAASKLGRGLEEKKRQGNPYYRPARFYTLAQAQKMLNSSGFTMLETWATRLNPDDPAASAARPGCSEEADFCILVCGKKEEP